VTKIVGVAALLLLLAVPGCTSRPVENLRDVPITTEHTPVEIRDAIIAAGATKGWVIQEIAPGQLRAVLNIRTHRAEADIAYSNTRYAITYADSKNLDYKDGSIHRNYNKWIANLNHAIQDKLNGKTTPG
jgi:hypothetical protein